MTQHEIGPALKDALGDVQAPVDGLEEGHLVGVDLVRAQSRDLAPGAGRVVAILQVLGGQDQGGQEHAPTTLERPHGRAIFRLGTGEVEGGDAVLDADEVVERHLQGRIAGTRSTERLLDEGLERQHATSRSEGARRSTGDIGQRPDHLDDLRC